MHRSVKIDNVPFEAVSMSKFNKHQLLAFFYISANSFFEEETKSVCLKVLAPQKLTFSVIAVLCFGLKQTYSLHRLLLLSLVMSDK